MTTIQDVIGDYTPLSNNVLKVLKLVRGAIACKIFFTSNLDDRVCRMGLTRISDDLGIDSSTASKNLKWLVTNGYVELVKEHTPTEPAHYRCTQLFYDIAKGVDLINRGVDKVNRGVDLINQKEEIKEEIKEENMDDEEKPSSDDYSDLFQTQLPTNGNPPKTAEEAKARTAQAMAQWQLNQDGLPTQEIAAHERLLASGWQLQPQTIVQAATKFMAYTPFDTPPPGDTTRKGWYKALKEHVDNHGTKQLVGLYRRATEALFPMNPPPDWKAPTGPWAYTKTMAGIVATDKQNGSPTKEREKMLDLEGNWTGGYYDG